MILLDLVASRGLVLSLTFSLSLSLPLDLLLTLELLLDLVAVIEAVMMAALSLSDRRIAWGEALIAVKTTARHCKLYGEDETRGQPQHA